MKVTNVEIINNVIIIIIIITFNFFELLTLGIFTTDGKK